MEKEVKITCEADHEAAMREIEALMSRDLDTNGLAHLDGVMNAVVEYEEATWPIDPIQLDGFLDIRSDGTATIRGTSIEAHDAHAWLSSGISIADLCEKNPDLDPLSLFAAGLWIEEKHNVSETGRARQ